MSEIFEYIITFGIDIIVTIIGFWLALKGNDYQEKKKEIADAKQCVNDLKEELININELINTISDFDVSCYIDPLKTPVWTGLKNTNKLQLLAKLRQYNLKKKEDVVWYNMLFEVYERIEEFNKWCNLFTENNYFALLVLSDENDIERRTRGILENIFNLREKLLKNNSAHFSNQVKSITEVIEHLNKIK